MAADTSYPLAGQSIYTKQGSTEMVIGSTSLLTIDGTLQQNGLVNFSTNYVLMGSTVGTTITSYGVSVLAGRSTDGGALTYTVAAPRVGVRKTIFVTSANTTDRVIVDFNNNTFIGYGTQDILVFTVPGTAATLIGVTTSTWAIESMSPLTTGTIGVATTS